MTERLLVVGGDAAGASAAATARRRRTADELDIVLFEKGHYTSYAACGIPYYVGGLVHDWEALISRSPEEHRARGVDARTEHEVLAIDLAKRTLSVRDVATSKDSVEPFDQLVIATGAEPVRPPIPGIQLPGVFGVQHLDDGLAMRHAVDELSPRHAVVVGGGYIGLEMAEALIMRGLKVSLVETASQPMSTLDPDMGELVADAMDALGIEVRLREPVQGFEAGSDGRVRAVVTEHRTIPADLVVLGLGVRPSSSLAHEAGIDIGETTHGIVTDDHMRTSSDGVFASGDCVETLHRVSRRRVSIALGTHASKQGVVAGANATGGDDVFPGVIGTAMSKICALEVARTGLNEREADDAGFAHYSVAIDSLTRASYFPGSESIRVKLVCEQGTGRLLGAQIVGKEGAAKRIDVLAACIWNEMTANEVKSLDLSYAPPFAPVWDPVLAAARRAVAELA